MTYCTVAEAKSAGARGSAAELAAAIADATQRVDRYCGDLFAPTPLTITAEVDGNGYAYVHRRIVSVSSVTWAGSVTPIDPVGYRVSSSSQLGGRDRIELAGALGWSDVTILGAEPWAGGWLGYASRFGAPTVDVVGVFGWDAVPGQVRDATAQLAAYLRGSDADADDPTAQVDVEGNVLPVAPSAQPAKEDSVRDRTTGSAVADELLADYVRAAVRIG